MHGPYSSFYDWRIKIAQMAGLPPLEFMEGFYKPLTKRTGPVSLPTLFCDGALTSTQLLSLDSLLPIRWDCLKPRPLIELLFHSDSDGDIKWENCAVIADELEALLPKFLEDPAYGGLFYYEEKTKQFIAGLRLAFTSQENLEFH